MTLCVYALTAHPSRRLSATGVSGERLRLASGGRLAAVVGELPRAPRPSPANLRRYDATIRALAARLPAVLPARFGTCFSNPDELAFVLHSRDRSLRRALAHVRNRVQMTVRVIGKGGVGIGDRGSGIGERAGIGDRGFATHDRDFGSRGGSVIPDPRSPIPGPGSRYLRARSEAAAREREIPGFEPVRDAVRRWVRDERVEHRLGIATAYHLVPRASAEAYRRAVERAAAAAGLQVFVSGPWPAYAFAESW